MGTEIARLEEDDSGSADGAEAQPRSVEARMDGIVEILRLAAGVDVVADCSCS